MAEQPKRPARRLARRLDTLFRTVHPPGKKEYTYAQVSDGIVAAGGPRLSISYLQQLRLGVKDNPTVEVLEGIAAFFGVKVGYFFSDEYSEHIDDGVALLINLLDAGALNIATRLPDLPPASQEVVRQVVDHLRQLEGLPDAVPGQASSPAAAAEAGGGQDDDGAAR